MLFSVADALVLALAFSGQLVAPDENLRVAAQAMDARDYPVWSENSICLNLRGLPFVVQREWRRQRMACG